MNLAPQSIPFNIIDRAYLITESDAPNANHFPMSPVGVIKLQEAVTHDKLLPAFQRLAKNYPYLRLAYQLDYQKLCWKHIPEAELADFLAACVHILPEDCPIETHLGNAIAFNNESLSQPINVFIAGQYLMLRMHHSFGDGKFLNLMMNLLLCELSGRKAPALSVSNLWWKPIWRIVWQNFGEGTQIIWQFIKSSFDSYQEFKQDTQSPTENTRSPIVTASPMAVRYKKISAKNLTILSNAKYQLSLNTVLQVMIAEHLKQLNIQQEPVTYTIPVDLRRYLPDPDTFYPSNLASQVRISLKEGNTLAERCSALQNQIQAQLHKKTPLIGTVGEWLLAVSGKKTYQSVNRDWLLKSTYNDPRRFIMSNVGKLDSVFAAVDDLLAQDFAPHIAIPLMGGPALVFCFNTFHEQGHILLSYDPQVFSSTDIDAVLSVFDAARIQTIAQQLHEAFQNQ